MSIESFESLNMALLEYDGVGFERVQQSWLRENRDAIVSNGTVLKWALDSQLPEMLVVCVN